MNSPFLTHFREVGWEFASMTILYEIEVADRHEILQEEKIEILKYLNTELCLNQNRPVRTTDEKKQQDKESSKLRRAEQKDRERQRVAEWRAKNPEKYAAQVRRSVEEQRAKRRSNHFS